jgi:hypothetical protein
MAPGPKQWETVTLSPGVKPTGYRLFTLFHFRAELNGRVGQCIFFPLVLREWWFVIFINFNSRCSCLHAYTRTRTAFSCAIRYIKINPYSSKDACVWFISSILYGNCFVDLRVLGQPTSSQTPFPHEKYTRFLAYIALSQREKFNVDTWQESPCLHSGGEIWGHRNYLKLWSVFRSGGLYRLAVSQSPPLRHVTGWVWTEPRDVAAWMSVHDGRLESELQLKNIRHAKEGEELIFCHLVDRCIYSCEMLM